jgi:hypothetical protein
MVPRRYRFVLFAASLALVACGSSGDANSTSKGGTSTSSATGAGAGGQGKGGATTGTGGAGTGGHSGTAGGGTGGSGAGGHTGGGGSTGSGGNATTGTGGGTTTSGQGGQGGSTGSAGHGGGGGCAKDADCDDGVYCNGAETCSAGACHAAATPACDDGIPCTKDSCDEQVKGCTHAPDDAVCDDGLACDGKETCDAKLGCVAGPPESCDDGVACTTDVCDAVTGDCKHVPSDLACDDGKYCDGIEHCDPAHGDAKTGCTKGDVVACDDGIPCTTDACSEAQQGCVYAPNDALCDDGSFCNGAEQCVIGLGCMPSAPVVCDDQRTCTSDECSDALKKCVFTPHDAPCDDGLFCNGVEHCDPAGPAPTGCVAGTPVACANDGIACTNDGCLEATKACASVPDNSLCPNGQFCVVAKGGCTPAKPCTVDADCNDGDDCNGVETCNVTCVPGKPVNCDDGIACTTDSCNPVGGTCAHAPNDAFCDNGLACDGKEVCSPQAGCVKGKPVACDDGIACTFDQCTEPSGACLHQPNDSVCDDNKFCDGIEVCTLQGCKPGTPPSCDDGIACTHDTCDPVTDTCKASVDDSLCPCGQTCNAQKGGCGNFCVVATCQGKVYQCGNCLDDDGDCKIDSADSQCLGPCDNSEDSLSIAIPGANNAPCKQDCAFDGDTGSGNDDCYWSHKCDPREIAPAYPPEGSQCSYDAKANISGTQMTCSQAMLTQSAQCLGYCGPLTPNGCDCFGCCSIPGAPTPVWLGSNISGVPSCTIDNVGDPTKCEPCTQVTACLNTCKHCELCVGKPVLPADCAAVECPAGEKSCGLPGDPPCPQGFSCVTGCCPANPQ